MINATLTSKDDTTNYSFTVNHENRNYDVIVYLNARGKFIDDRIYFNEEELGHEGEEGEIREAIMDYLDENWDKLV